jgi:hypothetical protein
MCYGTVDAWDVWNFHDDGQFVRTLRFTSRKVILTLTITSTIHLFLSVRSASLTELPNLTRQPNACLDCQHHHRHGGHVRGMLLAEHEVGLTGARFGHTREHGFDDAHEPFIYSRDVDSRKSSEYQTSGFNSPRRSAETLATDLRTDLGDIADYLA